MALAGVAAWWITGAGAAGRGHRGARGLAHPQGRLRASCRGLATPLPPPPPPGELRKVRLIYRCSLCGTEVRMTSANDEVPEPPRHCMEDMDLVAPVE